MRTTFSYLTAAATVLALSGCEAVNTILFPPQNATVQPPTEMAARPAPTTVTPDLRPGVKPPSPPPRIGPQSLVGKTQAEVRTILGPPTTTENAAPATIWRYSTATCSLEVLFYMDLGINMLRSLEYKLKMPESATNDDAVSRCLGAIQSINRISTR